jgi:DNA-binding NtrC family response regulator
MFLEHQAPKILVVDRNHAYCEMLQRLLTKRGHSVLTASSFEEALICAEQQAFDLILTDSAIHDALGRILVNEFRRRGRGEAIILMTGSDDTGADQDLLPLCEAKIEKPFHLSSLATLVDEVLLGQGRDSKAIGDAGKNGKGRLAGVSDSRRASTVRESDEDCGVVGNSPVIKELLTMVERVARTNSSVLITGATGTGKELIARTIHARSTRRNAPFVDINCSAIPDTLIEAELFGHQRGTFTGAHETRRGLFEEASGGTLFLDEVDALNLAAQAKLLRVLQERRVRRVGGRENIPIDVRIISATNRDLNAAIADGAFRADLLFRLRVFPLHVAELHERGDDIRLLVNHCLKRHSERNGTQLRRFSADAMRVLLSYRWPGNVRELENTIEYALAISMHEVMEIEALPPEIRNGHSVLHSERVFDSFGNLPLAEVERRHILAVLKRCDGHQIKTATVLGIDRRTLYRKLQQYGVLQNSNAQIA